jgi:ABC-type bacteriocin/lantibiotic exporter with double-glycine peptidase domain
MLKTALARLKGKVTMVMVSQRPSLLALADHVYDVRQGDLVLRKSRSTNTKPRGRPRLKTWKDTPPARKQKALAS